MNRELIEKTEAFLKDFYLAFYDKLRSQLDSSSAVI